MREMNEEEVNKLSEQFISTEEFNKELDGAIEHAQMVAGGGDSIDITPTMLIKDVEGKLTMVVMPDFMHCQNHKERADYLSTLGKKFGQDKKQLLSVYFIC